MTGDLSIDAQPRYEFTQSLLQRLAPPPADVVELGSAPGDQIAQLSQRGYQCTSVDIGIASDEWADGSSGRMRQLLESCGVRHIEWNLEIAPYPLPDQICDVVVMTEVFEHLRDFPINALRESHRILRSGGYLILTTPNQAYIRNRFKLLLGHNVQTPLADWVAGVPWARHAREYLVEEMCELVQLAGFEVRLVESRHFHKHSGRASVVARTAKAVIDALARLKPTLGPSIILVAQRINA